MPDILQSGIDTSANIFADAIERVQIELVQQIVDLRQQGLTNIQIVQVLEAIDMESYLLNDLGLQSDIDNLMLTYANVLENLNGFGAVTEESLQALIEIDRAFFMSESQNMANTVRQQLARGVLADVSESELTRGILDGMGGVLRKDQAATLANTALNSYSRNVTKIMADEMPEDTKYYYQGALDDRTRDVCLDMIAAGELTQSEVESSYGGAFVDGGGFNCRHRWTMVTSTVKTKDSQARKEIGTRKNYNPVTARGVSVGN